MKSKIKIRVIHTRFCYFCRYHRNLSVTYFKYLRSFSIQLSRHDCRRLFVKKNFAFGGDFDAGGNLSWVLGANWRKRNGLVSSEFYVLSSRAKKEILRSSSL